MQLFTKRGGDAFQSPPHKINEEKKCEKKKKSGCRGVGGGRVRSVRTWYVSTALASVSSSCLVHRRDGVVPCRGSSSDSDIILFFFRYPIGIDQSSDKKRGEGWGGEEQLYCKLTVEAGRIGWVAKVCFGRAEIVGCKRRTKNINSNVKLSE